MKQYDFSEKVKEHFQYLVDDYGFSVTDREYQTESFGNILVEYQSDVIGITVVLDRGHVSVDIGPLPKLADYQFGLPTIIEFLMLEADEATYIVPEKPDDPYEKIDWQVNRLGRLLRNYCEPVLRGEFLKWEEMDEWRKNKVGKMYRSLTGKTPVELKKEEYRDSIQKEINRRIKKNKQSTYEVSSSVNQKKDNSSTPWWSFWRRQK